LRNGGTGRALALSQCIPSASEALDRLKADALKLVAAYVQNGVLPTSRAVNFVTARKPA